jgi:hypothetical protein
MAQNAGFGTTRRAKVRDKRRYSRVALGETKKFMREAKAMPGLWTEFRDDADRDAGGATTTVRPSFWDAGSPDFRPRRVSPETYRLWDTGGVHSMH